jgi:c-di-GMP-related signal transduction protein
MKKFIARQPIFTTGKDILGYEVLFRSGPENYFSGNNTSVSAAVVDNLLLFGIERVTSGRLAFLNCTRDFLLNDYLRLLPPDRLVAEILETVLPDKETLEACRGFKRSGYQLALDDFVDKPEMEPFVELADYNKVDFLTTPPLEQGRLARELGRRDVRLIAEKVETHEDVQRGIAMGYHYFQGYFFCRSQMANRSEVPAYKWNYLRPAFALRTNVDSIPHALTLLGEDGIRRWLPRILGLAYMTLKPDDNSRLQKIAQSRFTGFGLWCA